MRTHLSDDLIIDTLRNAAKAICEGGRNPTTLVPEHEHHCAGGCDYPIERLSIQFPVGEYLALDGSEPIISVDAISGDMPVW